MCLLTIEMHQQTSGCCCFGFFVENMDGLELDSYEVLKWKLE